MIFQLIGCRINEKSGQLSFAGFPEATSGVNHFTRYGVLLLHTITILKKHSTAAALTVLSIVDESLKNISSRRAAIRSIGVGI